MDWLLLISGIAAGFLLGFIIVRLTVKTKLLSLEKKIEESAARALEEKSGLEREQGVLEERIQNLERLRDQLEEQLSRERESHKASELKYAAKEEAYTNLMERLDSEKKQVEELQKKFQTEFENLATRILKQNTEDFDKTSSKKLQDVLNPLKEKIEKFEAKVQETYEKGKEDHLNLKHELKNLQELSMRLDEDAKNLTKALKSDTKKQGNWGEIILERILEESGLIKNEEYYLQHAAKSEDGSRYRPDAVIRLPEEKHLVIDSKVSLTAYTEYVSAETDIQRQAALKRHLESIRKHVKELGDKNYSDLLGINSPDFVLMFLPVESAFGLAVQTDHELFNFAWNQRIVIVSPTTLLATLRTVASIWKYEKQSQNALEIARRGGLLYDKFEGFVKDLDKIGSSLDSAGKAYQAAHNKLITGKGNLVSQAEQLKKMGVTTKKSLPSEYLEDGE